ncbi:MAG: hypothetical protein AAF328_05955 [Planctomycetota bacterium]
MELIRVLFDWGILRTDYGFDALIYAVLAAAGTAIFVLRLGLMLLFGIDGDADIDISDVGDGAGFSIFSILSVTAFLMGAGWMGLVARVDWELTPPVSAALSAGFGVALMLFASSLLFYARKMTHEVKLDPTDAIGKVGTVYMQIPAQGEGSGQVRVVVQGQQMTLRAISTAGPLASFSDVTVTDARGDGTLVVEPVA